MSDRIDITEELEKLDDERELKQKELAQKLKEEKKRQEGELRKKREKDLLMEKLSRPEDFEEDFILPIINPSVMQVGCGFRDCSECCHETEMILTLEDLSRIEKLGYSREEFCLNPRDADGFWQLRNIGGKCFFLSDSGNCTIYENRPMGCRLYPLILTLDTNEVVVDDDCRETEWFEEQEYERDQIVAVHNLVSTLLLEKQDIFFDQI